MILSNCSDQLEQKLDDLAHHQRSQDQAMIALQHYADYIGLEAFTLDENNSATLTVDGEVELHLLYLEASDSVMASVQMQPAICDRAELLQQVLQANMDWILSQGAVFH